MEKLGAQVSAHTPSESDDSSDGYESDDFIPNKLPRTDHLIFIYCYHYLFKIVDLFIYKIISPLPFHKIISPLPFHKNTAVWPKHCSLAPLLTLSIFNTLRKTRNR